MPRRTINLSFEEEGAAIIILRGIHNIEPIGNFTLTGKCDFLMWERTNEVVEILLSYERAFDNAYLDGNTSDDHELWRYIHDELIGDEDTGYEHDEDELSKVREKLVRQYRDANQ